MAHVVLNHELVCAKIVWPTHPKKTSYKAVFNSMPPLFVYDNSRIEKTWVIVCQFS